MSSVASETMSGWADMTVSLARSSREEATQLCDWEISSATTAWSPPALRSPEEWYSWLEKVDYLLSSVSPLLRPSLHLLDNRHQPALVSRPGSLLHLGLDCQ
jgi:hypothetical protein